ncbi:copper amine oxidase N-terminal domain-containing protein [Paenibacillus sp. LHD-38]|uniref:copper amine oxidase N-terminal domain-containing protein n=1 Tax=Paenibacillus sp. LHD-38 TaxID=3072143 RepID=UPI00280EA337|nr:copper amine oxidase N-terminal domain-containing protein [Paenibacillus sp. LHD-38]MDQ8739456.1 copper amine oxidase N-terminal domain-containing protein [Paenibacillus sp. LHD-38]
MKKLVFAVAAASLLAVSATSYAAVPVKIFVEDKQIQSDVAPIVENGRLLVPIRAMTDSLGASVSWDQASKTATIRKWSETVKLTAGKNTSYYEKEGRSNQLTFDVPLKIVNNRLYVPLRFLSQFFGYQVATSGDAVFVNSPLSQNERDILYRGDLAQARRIVMDNGPKTAHFAQKPIAYTHEREGFETTFLFPIGESNRFFLISDDTVSFYELQDDFFVVTWQAHIPVGQKGTVELFLENKVTNATGSKPEIKEFFFYRTGGLVTSTNITTGTIDSDGKITVVGVKRIVGGEVKEESGSLALKSSDEKRTITSNS